MDCQAQYSVLFVQPVGGGDGEEQVGDLALVVGLDGDVGHIVHVLVCEHLHGLGVRPLRLRQFLRLLLEIRVTPAHGRHPRRTGADVDNAYGSLWLSFGSLNQLWHEQVREEEVSDVVGGEV